MNIYKGPQKKNIGVINDKRIDYTHLNWALCLSC